MRRLVFSVGLLLAGVLAAAATAQPLHPAPGPVFDSSRLPVVRITLHPDTLAWILDPANARSDIEWRATFQWDDGATTETVEEIGFRLRGNTSRTAAKKSWKVSFNTYQRGRQWNGLEKLNLNGEHNDPTLMRSTIAWDLVAASRLPGSRTGFVRMEVNGADFGVYANVEHIDENFLATHFRDGGGALYKCLYPADLADLGDDPAAYRDLAPNGRPVYELAQGDGDHSDIAALAAALNRTPAGSFPFVIERLLDVNGVLRALAFDVLSGNWDGYAYNQNNYYLYNDPEIGVFRYIPYDLDNTLGIDFLGPDWGTRDLYTWPEGTLDGSPVRPLAKRLLLDADYRARFSFYVRQMLDGPFQSAPIDARISALRTVLEAAVAADPYRPLDYGWTFDQYAASFDAALGGHVEYGLRPFVTTRRASALSQLVAGDVAPILSERRHAPRTPLAGETATVRVWVEDEGTPASVALVHRVDGGPWQSARAMADEGAGVYAATLGPFDGGAVVDYYVEASDVGGRTRQEPRLGDSLPASFTVAALPAEGLVVNEILASNAASNTDPNGDFDDWIELFNASAEPISLAGLFITDNFNRPDKFALPDTVLAPGAHVIVWADEEQEQGPMHANFKLGAGGEDVGVFAAGAGGGFVMVDGFEFGPQTTDISYGRETDGADAFVFFPTPTPGAPNAGGVATAAPPAETLVSLVSLAPNPSAGPFRLTLDVARTATVTVEVLDVLGRAVGGLDARRLAPGRHRLDGAAAPAAGVYLVRVRAEADGTVVSVSQRVTVAR